MIDLFKANTTLRECSYDSEHCEYMTSSEISAACFDKVMPQYVVSVCGEGREHIHSNDALFKYGERWYFIEFKNGNIDHRVRAEIKLKMYDSLLAFLDVLKETVTFSRQNVIYILVYNGLIDHRFTKCSSGVAENSKAALWSAIADKANQVYDAMYISQYKGLYFYDVQALEKEKFHQFLSDKAFHI